MRDNAANDCNRKMGWIDSIRDAASATGHEWDPEVGWVEVVERDFDDGTMGEMMMPPPGDATDDARTMHLAMPRRKGQRQPQQEVQRMEQQQHQRSTFAVAARRTPATLRPHDDDGSVFDATSVASAHTATDALSAYSVDATTLSLPPRDRTLATQIRPDDQSRGRTGHVKLPRLDPRQDSLPPKQGSREAGGRPAGYRIK